VLRRDPHAGLTIKAGRMQTTSGLSGNRIGTALRYLVGITLLTAIAIMLIGVLLRYLVGPLSQALNLPRVDFFWVEEAGEMLLGWLTFIGAGLGILERSHFGISIFVESLSPAAQRLIYRFNMLLAAGFGLMLAWHGWQLARLNATLTTPALEISMGWLYAALVAGGLLIAICALIVMVRPLNVVATEHVVS
jgi:TRAP-type C4-dicarboxylate transport system permease small subunit